MKKIFVLLLTAVIIIPFSMVGCGKRITPKETSRIEEGDAKEKKDIIAVRTLQAEPDYDYQVWKSDDIIFGEVIEELEGRYSTTEGEVADMWLTPYVVKVEKSYKGVINEGDTIIINAWNFFSPEEKNEFILVEDYSEFYLHEGQRGIFMLAYSGVPTDGRDETTFYVVMENDGIFEAKNKDVSLMSEDEDVVYASANFEITLDQIAGDIQKADELYKDVDKNAPSEIFVNDDEIDATAGQTNGITE